MHEFDESRRGTSPYEPGEDAWSDLGGRPVELTPKQERDFVAIDLGSQAMKNRVEKVISEEQRIEQDRINHEGAEQWRQAGRDIAASKGIEETAESRAMEIVKALRRGQRS